MKKIKIILFLLISAICLFFGKSISGKFVIVKAEEAKLVNDAKSAVLIEPKTKTVLYDHDKDKQLFPASMTKIVTLKLVLDAISDKRLTWNQMVTASKYASSMGGSQIYLAVGEQMSVEDLFKSVAIVSANDAAVALAEAISGSEEQFVQMMNKETQKLGLQNTHFANCTGLPIENHYTSSYDMGILGANLINLYEDTILKYTSRYEDYIRENTAKKFWLVNTNKMVRHVEGVDGLKTGWTEEAGYCITTTMKKNGMRLVSVVMGCTSVDLRTKDTLAILNYGFASYQTEIIIHKNTVVRQIENIKLNPQKIDIIVSDDVILIKNALEKLPNYTIEIKIDEAKINNFQTTKIGILTILDEEKKAIGKVDLDLKVKTKKASFWQILISIMQNII